MIDVEIATAFLAFKKHVQLPGTILGRRLRHVGKVTAEGKFTVTETTKQQQPQRPPELLDEVIAI